MLGIYYRIGRRYLSYVQKGLDIKLRKRLVALTQDIQIVLADQIWCPTAECEPVEGVGTACVERMGVSGMWIRGRK
jgi:hypothetical protein